ncbi:MAG: hypothetical protein QXN71_02630 [Candidatus Aenigmatarchaeota archaeon]
MKKIVRGLKGTYLVKFSDTELTFPEKLLSVLEGFSIRGFETVLVKEEYSYLQMFPTLEEKGYFFTLENGKTRIPRSIKDCLGIENKGYVIGISYMLELWGPSWELHKKQLDSMDFSEIDVF